MSIKISVDLHHIIVKWSTELICSGLVIFQYVRDVMFPICSIITTIRCSPAEQLHQKVM
jgi:hypothetical protein